MQDNTSRITKIGDALSQLLNVTLLPNHQQTTANESISGRSYRMKWVKATKVIDFVLGDGHCREAYLNDIDRASQHLRDSFDLKNTNK